MQNKLERLAEAKRAYDAASSALGIINSRCDQFPLDSRLNKPGPKGYRWLCRVHEHLRKQVMSANDRGFPVFCRLITFGLGGHREYYTDNSSLSGYDKPEQWKPDREHRSIWGTPAEPDFYEGALVVDSRAVFEKDPGFALRSPMAEARLIGPEFARCPEPSDVLLSGLKGMFQAMAVHRTCDPEFKGLDTVSPETYAALHKQAGARIGVIQDGQIVWSE